MAAFSRPMSPYSVAHHPSFPDPSDEINHIWIEHPLFDRLVSYNLVETWERMDWMVSHGFTMVEPTMAMLVLVNNLINGAALQDTRHDYLDLRGSYSISMDSFWYRYGVRNQVPERQTSRGTTEAVLGEVDSLGYSDSDTETATE